MRFPRSLYEAPAVHAAVRAYAHLGRFEVVEREAEVEVSVEPADDGIPDLEDWFANHVLYESVRLWRATPREAR